MDIVGRDSPQVKGLNVIDTGEALKNAREDEDDELLEFFESEPLSSTSKSDIILQVDTPQTVFGKVFFRKETPHRRGRRLKLLHM